MAKLILPTEVHQGMLVVDLNGMMGFGCRFQVLSCSHTVIRRRIAETMKRKGYKIVEKPDMMCDLEMFQ